MPKAKGYTVNTPKAALSLPVTTIQKELWGDRILPTWCKPYRYSPELMKIYKILIDGPRAWHDSILYDLKPQDKTALVFGTDYRAIYTYEAIEDFNLTVGDLKDKSIMTHHNAIMGARNVKQGDIILIRHDTRDETMSVDLQILSDSLFQDDSEDWKVFTLDSVDLKHVRKHLRLLDSEGVYEP